MIKLVIFDLDGVLADTDDIHYIALIESIKSVTGIKHGNIKKDGSTTKQKLLKLKNDYNLSDNQINMIDKLKQDIVVEKLKLISPNISQIKMLDILSKHIKCLAVGSNSRKINVAITLDTLRITSFFKYVLSGEDIINPKPFPDIFLKIMELENVLPTETLILEDSEKGLEAARRSGAHVLEIKSCADTTLENIINAINKANSLGPNGRDGVQIY